MQEFEQVRVDVLELVKDEFGEVGPQEMDMLRALSTASDTGTGRAFMRCAANQVRKLRHEIETAPMLGSERVEDGMQFKLGAIWALRRMLSMETAAKAAQRESR